MEPKVITFPKGRQRYERKTGDEKLVADIRQAWRRLARVIQTARNNGLTVETDFYGPKEPVITRRL